MPLLAVKPPPLIRIILGLQPDALLLEEGPHAKALPQRHAPPRRHRRHRRRDLTRPRLGALGRVVVVRVLRVQLFQETHFRLREPLRGQLRPKPRSLRLAKAGQEVGVVRAKGRPVAQLLREQAHAHELGSILLSLPLPLPLFGMLGACLVHI